MNEYIIKFWSTEGRLCGIRIFAMSMASAIEEVKAMPNCATIYSWDKA